jgi:YD repeat-containing protein
VVFQSEATNLAQSGVTDDNGASDVFVRDLQSNTTTLVSLNSSNVVGNGGSWVGPTAQHNAISSDGAKVVFSSSATNFSGGDGTAHAYLRNIGAGSTSGLDVTSGGALSDRGADGVDITTDGRYAGFWSGSSNLISWTPSPPGPRPQCFTNGDTCPQIYVRDLQGATTTIASTDSSGHAGTGGTGENSAKSSYAPSALAHFGRFQAFASWAPNLVSGDTNNLEDVFVHDGALGTTVRVSLDSGGNQQTVSSDQPAISSTGAYVAFRTNPISGLQQVYTRATPTASVPTGQTLGIGRYPHAANPSIWRAEPVNTATGSFYTSTVDASLPGIGIPFAFERSYNSADATSGPLGRGWTHSYNAFLETQWNGDVLVHAEDGQQLHFLKRTDGTFVGDGGVWDTLVRNGDSTYTLTRRDQVTYGFDPQGHMTSVRERNGQGLTLAYNGSKLTTITDSAGMSITLTYDANNLLTGLSLPLGRSITYGYTSGRLTSVTDPRGKVTSYTYDANGLLNKITDPRLNALVQNTYGSDGRVTQQTDALGNSGTFAWNPWTQTSIT